MGALGVTSSLPKPRRAKAVVCNRLSPRAYEKGPVAQNGAEVKTARPLPPRFVTPWATACQAFLSFTDSHSLLKLMSIKSVMPSNHLILCHPLLLLPSIFPSIRLFPNESVLHIRWPKYWSFSFSISPSNEYSG